MNWLNLWAEAFPTMLGGLKWTVLIAAASIIIGYPLGLLLSLGVTRKNQLVHWISLVIVEAGRGTPALVLLYLVYFGLPKAGLSFASIPAAIIALSFNAAAYSSEMLRAGMQSVHRGQREAAAALGLTSATTFTHVIFPQGIRSTIPALMGLAIQMFQGTSLAYAIAVPELMQQAYTVGSQNFQYLNTFILAGLMYAVISMPATWITVFFERRMNKKYA